MHRVRRIPAVAVVGEVSEQPKPGNGGVVRAPKGQTSAFYSVEKATAASRDAGGASRARRRRVERSRRRRRRGIRVEITHARDARARTSRRLAASAPSNRRRREPSSPSPRRALVAALADAMLRAALSSARARASSRGARVRARVRRARARVLTVAASPEAPPPVPDVRALDAATLDVDALDAFPRLASGKYALKGMRRGELADWLAHVGEKRSRADSVFRAMYRELGGDADATEAFGDKFKARLEVLGSFDGDLELSDTRLATDGTRKVTYNLRGSGGGTVESVLIPALAERGRTTVCVSSQLGCAMNCQFCYTAKMGLRKNLSAAQIVEQVVQARRMVGASEVSNVVFMGMGEPLHNVDEVLKGGIDLVEIPKD